MAQYLTTAEIKSHLYDEIANEISRNDNSIIESAILEAIDEVKSYLARYDVAAIFSYTASDTYPTLDSWLNARNKKLLSSVKDIAVWALIKLANPNIDLAFRRTLYEDAIEWLVRIQKGTSSPDLPLLPEVTGAEGTTKGAIVWGSNSKRKNHF